MCVRACVCVTNGVFMYVHALYRDNSLMKLLNDEDITIVQTCNAFMYSEPSIKVGVIGFTSVVSLPLLHTCDTVIL